MHLGVRKRNLRWALVIGTIRLHLDVSALKVIAGSLAESINHNDIDWCLGPKRSSIGVLSLGELHASVSLLFLFELDVELCA